MRTVHHLAALVAGVVVGAAMAPAWAGTPPAAAAPAVAESIDVAAILEPIRAKHGLPAMGGAVVRGGEVVAVGVSGVRKTGDPTPVTEDDLWHIGSCTKSMTATLCAVLVERGKLRWDMTLAEVFPDEAPTMHEAFRGVTLEQLLTNRGGVPTDLSAGGLWSQLWTFRGTPREARRLLLRSVTSRAPAAEPGTKFIYSNGGFAIAGHMAETVMDQPYEELMQELVFGPLGMTTVGWGAPGDPPPADGAITQPWGHTAKGDPVEPGIRGDNPTGIAPAGRAHLTLRDWGRYVALHVGGEKEEPVNGLPRLLKPETMRRLHTPPEGATGPGSDYAMGWGRTMRPWGGGHVLTHNGSNTMWFAVTWLAPEKDFAVLVTCNQGGDVAAKACDEAAGALIGAVSSR